MPLENFITRVSALFFQSSIAQNIFNSLCSLAARHFIEGGKELEILARGKTREK